ncbi:M23 family metallopeptidase [Candidatus Gottesmanbacteria bacterium]|nr:M23 family metallopeptidase [Candidatus Gottesmanbacteria bacterium]
MKRVAAFFDEFIVFLTNFYRHIERYVRRGWYWSEGKKDILVTMLVAKRGLYQRPFLHASFFVLAIGGVVGVPIIANNYTVSAQDQLASYTPPSAVLSSFDDQGTLTQESEKPRDKIWTHTVRDGETLGTIAEVYRVSIESIKWANPTLKDDKLSIGQKLEIPPVTGIVHKVKKGESIYSIAKKYQTDAQNILNFPFNDFADLDTFALTAGQTLIVPDGVMPEAKPVQTPKLLAQAGTSAGNGQFIWPINGIISQRPVSYHMALDIANPALPPILASDGGTVVGVEKQKYGYGWHVIIDHFNGFQTLYAHLSDIYVTVGQNVTKGAIIGQVGSTGRSSGPHLHFEIRKNGVALNPLGFLQ